MSVRALFISTGLGTGGAEKQLSRLLASLVRHGRIDPFVLSLQSGGPVAQEIMALGVPVESIGLSSITSLPSAVWRIRQLTRRFAPKVIQGWMYHGNLAATLSRSVGGEPNVPVAWGIRQTLYDVLLEKAMTRRVIQLSAKLSSRTQRIVYNSETSRVQHELYGFDSTNSDVIDNGFNTRLFHPDPSSRERLRLDLGLAPDALLVGLVTRFHPMKGHVVFLKAASLVAQAIPEVHFVFVGRDVSAENPALREFFALSPLRDRTHCLGERSDMAQLSAALDVAVSASTWGDAFPNSVGEAMACAVPIIGTNIGDVPRIVGDGGIVVPAGDHQSMADEMIKLLRDPVLRRSMGTYGRARVIENFSIDAAAQSYTQLYEALSK